MIHADRFTAKAAIVTGAASGIGAATSRRLVAEGASVVGGDIDTAGLDRLAAELGHRFIPQACDVTSESAVEALVRTAVTEFGQLDAAFLVAGATQVNLITDMTEAEWDFTVDLCLKGVFFGVKHAGRQMIAQGGGGAIISIASLNSRVPMFFNAAYSSAKAGVAMLAQSGALELGPHRIRVCAVSPGLTDTPLVGNMISNPDVRAAFMDRIPLQRPATPDDIASAALYLGSDDASYITGVNLFVDGGWEQTAYPDMRPLLAAATADETG